MQHPLRRVRAWKVTIRMVRSISRKGQASSSGSSGSSTGALAPRDERDPLSTASSGLGIWNPQRPHAGHLISDDETKIWSTPHGDMRTNVSEIPCRVSSDLHEWRNDFPTVSTIDPAKLKYE